MKTENISWYSKNKTRILPSSRQRLERFEPYEQDLQHFRYEYMFFPRTIASAIVNEQIANPYVPFPFYTPVTGNIHWQKPSDFMDDLKKQLTKEGRLTENPILFPAMSGTDLSETFQTYVIQQDYKEHELSMVNVFSSVDHSKQSCNKHPLFDIYSLGLTLWKELGLSYQSENTILPNYPLQDRYGDSGFWYINPLVGCIQPVIMKRNTQIELAFALSKLVN